MKFQLVCLFSACLYNYVLCKHAVDVIDNNLVNSKVERKIDISTHLVKTNSIITLENKGSTQIKSFVFAVEPSLNLKKNIAFVKASVSCRYDNDML